MRPPKLLVVLKGYPRVSETFIAQELHGLQNAGIAFEIISLRRPYDPFRHPVHDQITAPVRYLPEYLHEEPLRVLASLLKVLGRRGLRKTLRLFLRDLRRDVTRNRVRRLGQAVVLAAEADPGEHWLHAHFAHTPTSVARYASTILGAPFTISAHAKDIWTSPEWELREKLTDARWSVTCTRTGCDYLRGIAPKSEVHLLYHGLDLERFPPPPSAPSSRDGTSTTDPVRILSIGRAVPKKGYDTLLRALAALPEDLHWHFDHIGGGAERPRLETLAEELGLGARLTWHGPQDQARVLEAYRNADIFVLASQATAENDRDGLPNVLVEAASQGLACVATRFSAIPELIEDGTSGLLVPPGDAAALADALRTAARAPGLRQRLGRAAEDRVRREFDADPGIRRLKRLFEESWAEAAQEPFSDRSDRETRPRTRESRP